MIYVHWKRYDYYVYQILGSRNRLWWMKSDAQKCFMKFRGAEPSESNFEQLSWAYDRNHRISPDFPNPPNFKQL